MEGSASGGDGFYSRRRNVGGRGLTNSMDDR